MPASRLITAWGETKSITEWINDRRAVVGYSAIYRRLNEGWPAEDAIATPRQQPGRRVRSRFTSTSKSSERPRVCLTPWQVSFIDGHADRLTVEEICERLYVSPRVVIQYCQALTKALRAVSKFQRPSRPQPGMTYGSAVFVGLRGKAAAS
jgi:hypothetical protein